MEKNRCLMGSLEVHGPKNSCPPFLWSFLIFFSVGQILELTWDVPASSGPGPSDPNCISYSYHSNVDFVKVKIPFIQSQKEDAHNSLFSRRKKNTYGLPLFPCDKLACRFIYCQDLYSGLLGPLVVCRPGTLSRGEGSDRQRGDVEVEFALLFMVHDENESWYTEDNIRKYLGVNPQSFVPDEDFGESNMMHGKR